MTRLPPALNPLWPLAKRAHRITTRLVGATSRTALRSGSHALPRFAYVRTADAAEREPEHVSLHVSGPAEHLDRETPDGEPSGLRFFDEVRSVRIPPRSVAEVLDGHLVGASAASITPGGGLDMETSPYFGIRDWREHPIFLAGRLRSAQRLGGTTVSLASPGSGENYYHALMDAAARWGVLTETLGNVTPDRIVVGHETKFTREINALLGIDQFPLVPPNRTLHIEAHRLLVPSINNFTNLAPRWTTQWLARALPPRATSGLPTRLFVTRGQVPHTRRLVQEARTFAALKRLGFVGIDPAQMTVQAQIDHFAAAEAVVAPHGAALTNLLFCRPGVRILEMFAPRYLNPGFWAIADNIPHSRYRYIVAPPAEVSRPAARMSGVQDDIDIEPMVVLEAAEELLST